MGRDRGSAWRGSVGAHPCGRTGHGHSAFTIHATSAGHVWPRFLQGGQAHPDAARMSEIQIAQSFAEAVTAAVYIERNSQHGQIVREIVEVSTLSWNALPHVHPFPLFKHESGKGLVPTGNRPMRPGFRATDLNILKVFSNHKENQMSKIQNYHS